MRKKQSNFILRWICNCQSPNGDLLPLYVRTCKDCKARRPSTLPKKYRVFPQDKVYMFQSKDCIVCDNVRKVIKEYPHSTYCRRIVAQNTFYNIKGELELSKTGLKNVDNLINMIIKK